MPQQSLDMVVALQPRFQLCGAMQAYASNFRMGDGSVYVSSGVRAAPGAPHLTGTTDEIENLRPRSPPPNQRH